MKKHIVSKVTLVGLCILVFSLGASAHENHTYRIGDKVYQINIGSLNEPVVVDDKTGLDLRVEHPAVGKGEPTPVTGLDQTLKVEITAGGKKKVFNIQPAFGQQGAYRTTFYPTVQTTLAYRLFGTINEVPVDLSFTCHPAGHPRAPEDKTEVKISDQVSRLNKRGTFGCPGAKADVGFPEPAPSAFDLQTKVDEMNAALTSARAQASRAQLLGLAGVVIGLVGLGFGWMGVKKTSHIASAKRPSPVR